MKDLPLSKVYQLLGPGPVVLLTTALKGRANVTTSSTGDKGYFVMGLHGYILMARMPCSWYRVPTVGQAVQASTGPSRPRRSLPNSACAWFPVWDNIFTLGEHPGQGGLRRRTANSTTLSGEAKQSFLGRVVCKSSSRNWQC